MSEDAGEEVAAQAVTDDDEDKFDVGQCIIEGLAVVFASLLWLIFFPFLLPGRFRIIQQYERGLKIRLGKANKQRGVEKPGVTFIFPFIETLWVQDVRTKCFQCKPQQVLTKDSVSIQIGAVLTVNVTDPFQCLMIGQGNPRFVEGAAVRRVQNTLRAACGHLTLTEIINGRDKLSKDALRTMKRKWGSTITITRVEIQDITIPPEMQRSMASEAISQRQARAKLISAEGEIQASHMLKDAADIVAQSPAAIHLRYFQSLITVSKKNCKTVVFPFPPQLAGALKMDKGGGKHGKHRKQEVQLTDVSVL